MVNCPRVSAIQMVSTTDLETNLKVAQQLIVQAVNAGSQMVLLPEYFAIMASQDKDKLQMTERHGKGKVQSFLATMAKRFQLWIIGGTHPIESVDAERPYARCYVYSPEGECVCWYDKIHLFDVNVSDNLRNYNESRHASAGDTPVIFDSPWGKIGLAVCYDLRFAELFRYFSAQGVSIIMLSAAFTVATGKYHWEVLLKARAIENLSFLVASAQGGNHKNGRQTWGHSCIISPWGKILAEQTDGEGVVTCSLDLNEQNKLRNEFPALTHRRL